MTLSFSETIKSNKMSKHILPKYRYAKEVSRVFEGRELHAIFDREAKIVGFVEGGRKIPETVTLGEKEGQRPIIYKEASLVAGAIKNGIMRSGVLNGGVVSGTAEINGASINGGQITGGVLNKGTTVLGGQIKGGTFNGAIIHGGTISKGVFQKDVRIFFGKYYRGGIYKQTPIQLTVPHEDLYFVLHAPEGIDAYCEASCQEAEFKDASWRGRSYQQGLDVGYNDSKIKITQDYVEWLYRQYLKRAHEYDNKVLRRNQ
jgi:hypothetical protein